VSAACAPFGLRSVPVVLDVEQVEPQRRPAGAVLALQPLDRLGRDVEADVRAALEEVGQLEGEPSGPAPDLEQVHRRLEAPLEHQLELATSPARLLVADPVQRRIGLGQGFRHGAAR